jgi:hypothetical protein
MPIDYSVNYNDHREDDMADKDERLTEAVDTIARAAAFRALDHALAAERIEWADYPEVGEFDWEVIQKRVEAIAKSLLPTPAQVDAAYEFLSARSLDEALKGGAK